MADGTGARVVADTSTDARLIAAALRGDAASWPAGTRVDTLLRTAAWHGVEGLLDQALHHADGEGGWPDEARTVLRARVRSMVATEPIERRELCRVLARLFDGGVHALMLKGAALAHTHYPQPWLRPRADIDLLVRPDDAEATGNLLRELGYEPVTAFDGELVTNQMNYTRIDRLGMTHVVDVHVRIANPHVFAGLLTFEELAGQAVSIPALGPAARAPSPAHALLLACIHRVAHHYSTERLLWLYDIHLLTRALTVSERQDLVELAAEKKLRAVCASGLALARRHFAARIDDPWLATLASGATFEPTAEFLHPGRTKTDILLSDLRSLTDWRSRLQLIREHLFPPRAYLEHVYSLRHPALLPFAYTHRIVAGVAHWFRRHSQ